MPTRSMRTLAAMIFFQILPATLIAPAIRPLFAAHHGGNEGAMQAFMGINMLGAVIAAPLIGWRLDKLARPGRLLALLALIDAALLFAVALPIPIWSVLSLRFLEGAAHVGAATMLLAEAAAISRVRGEGRTMGLAGAAIIFAVALGSALGGLILTFGPAAPFTLGSIILVGVAIAAAKSGSGATRVLAARERGGLSMLKNRRELVIPVAAAFIERFTVGCIIVTFALFAHRAHGLSDRSIGLLFALLTFTFALSMYPVGRLTERIPRAYVLACGAALYCAALAALGYVPTMGLPLVMIAAGASSSMLYAPTLSYASALSGSESRSKVMALINAAGCLGMLVGPMLAGVTSATLRGSDDPIRGYRAVFLLAAFSVALWLLASLRWLFRQLRAERPNLVCPMRNLVPAPEQAEEEA